jgi:hypothetical protein
LADYPGSCVLREVEPPRRFARSHFDPPPNAAQVSLYPCGEREGSGYRESSSDADAQWYWIEPVPSRDSTEMENLVVSKSLEFVGRIEQQLAMDSDEAADPESVTPTSSAVGTCLTFAEQLAPHVALAPQLKAAAFAEDEGGISLVLQSLVTDRRLNYRIPPQGDRVTVIQIDERMEAKSTTISFSDRAATRELAKWVTTRV